MTAAAPIERIAASHARRAASFAGGAAWARRRRSALDRLVARGLPDRRDENWKYLDHGRIAGYDFEASAAGRLRPDDVAERLLALDGARRLVLVDGRYDAALSSGATSRKSVRGRCRKRARCAITSAQVE